VFEVTPSTGRAPGPAFDLDVAPGERRPLLALPPSAFLRPATHPVRSQASLFLLLPLPNQWVSSCVCGLRRGPQHADSAKCAGPKEPFCPPAVDHCRIPSKKMTSQSPPGSQRDRPGEGARRGPATPSPPASGTLKAPDEKAAKPGTTATRRADHLEFDGKALRWKDPTGKVRWFWAGYSGRPGSMTCTRDQAFEDYGPIPEGLYTVGPESIIVFAKLSWYRRLKYRYGAWGSAAAPCIPRSGTDTRGRRGFHIHGGTIPGSAGCIDVLAQDKDVMGKLRRYGRRIELRVKYPRPPFHSTPYVPPYNVPGYGPDPGSPRPNWPEDGSPRREWSDYEVPGHGGSNDEAHGKP